MDNIEPPTEQDPQSGTVEEAQARFDRPDMRKPRGNQEVEEIDVQRGEANIERVLGW